MWSNLMRFSKQKNMGNVRRVDCMVKPVEVQQTEKRGNVMRVDCMVKPVEVQQTEKHGKCQES